jgi:hypothetical protein
MHGSLSFVQKGRARGFDKLTALSLARCRAPKGHFTRRCLKITMRSSTKIETYAITGRTDGSIDQNFTVSPVRWERPCLPLALGRRRPFRILSVRIYAMRRAGLMLQNLDFVAVGVGNEGHLFTIYKLLAPVRWPEVDA